MPNPLEVCVVTAGGEKYDIWETVEVTTTTDDVIDHALLTVAEPSGDGAKTLSDIKLKPGDPATVSLAGQVVIDGIVYLRQATFDANSHSVQIGISSKAQSVIASTVKAEPGQYINQTIQQIGSAVFGEVGVKFTINGNPAGADKIFPRVSEHVGETRFSFIERLSRMRNLHLVDDGQNGIMAFRGPQGRSQYPLQEGYNIKSARILLRNDEHASNLQAKAQNFNQDTGDANREPEASTTVDPPIDRNVTVFCEEPGDNADCNMRVNQEADWVKYNQVDGEVTVQGWFNPSGQLWWNDRRKVVVVKSPTLLPNSVFGFMIKGIIHRQDSEDGTTTTILLCRADGLGAGAEPLQGA